MKYICIIFAVLFLFGCDEFEKHNKMSESETFAFGMKTIEHDSCEYVVFKDVGRSSIAMLHKENCKYCSVRNKK